MTSLTGQSAVTIKAVPGYAKGRARREEILEVALQVFAEAGYRGASIKDIANRVGISQPGLLHHFASKEALLTAVLELRDESDRAAFGSDPLPRGLALAHLAIRVIEHNAQVPGLVQLYVTLSGESVAPDHPAHEYFKRRNTWVRGVIAESLIQACEDGDLRPDINAVALATLLMAVMDGLQVQWLLDPENVDMISAYKIFLDQLIAANSPLPAR